MEEDRGRRIGGGKPRGQAKGSVRGSEKRAAAVSRACEALL